VAAPAPGKVFTFPATRTATPTPKVAAETQVEIVAPIDTPLDLTSVSDETAEDEGDELLLGDEDILTTQVGRPPIEPPVDEDMATEDQPTAAGGTLFERMSNIARGASKAQIDEDDSETSAKREPIDIPRFLNRQNNQ
jgi:cell division protein FtsZ